VRVGRVLLLIVVGAALSCDAPTGPPRGQALVVIDTDMTVPKFVARVRVDFFTPTGDWYATRDIPAFKPEQWPLSFGVHLEDGEPAKDLVLRLRAYPDGKVRDYRGERFEAPPDDPHSTAVTQTAATDGPWLLKKPEITPATEPEPLVTIDRLVRIHVVPNAIGAARILLRGDCVGTMADIANGLTCVDQEKVRVPVDTIALDPVLDLKPSVQGAFERAHTADCTMTPRPPGTAKDGTPLYDEEVCVPGGVFMLGSQDGRLGDATDDMPERIAVVPPFLMERWEVTVARMRDAYVNGFTGLGPIQNDQPFPANAIPIDSSLCTFSMKRRDRDAFPVNCIPPIDARVFCQWAGADLPSEVQWEYTAAVVGRPARTHYPYGDSPTNPACSDIVYARSKISADTGVCGWAPLPVTAGKGDVLDAPDIHDLTGSMAEITNDPFVSLSADCWRAASLVSPHCDGENGQRTTRGASWMDGALGLYADNRSATGLRLWHPAAGLRCVRPGVP
jgi:formylglycine-generating enzyme required for sulfatase activity